MCDFLSIGIPGPLVGAAPERSDVKVVRYENKGSGHAYLREFATFFLMDSMCSCSLVRTTAPVSNDDKTVTKLERKARAKGWTAAKFERAKADALASAGKRPPSGLSSALHPDVLELIAGQLRSSPYVELIAHCHSGGVVEAERFNLVGAERLRYTELTELTHLAHDTRYRVTPDLGCGNA